MDQKHEQHLMNTYQRLNVAFERGEGVWLWDMEGKKYLDALAGIAVTVLGHANPAVTQAIQQQASKILHTSNLYHIPKQTELANELSRLSGLDQAFFCNSGAEALETALKLIRLYGHSIDIEFPQVIVMQGAFHGRTFATLSAGGNTKVQAGYDPLVPGFIRVPFNDIEAILRIADTHSDVAAVLLEPIQGEGGIQVPSDDYLVKVRDICDTNGWLMAIDEVQTGMGRTGSLFNYQAHGILPDILSLAKGLANGIPIGACIAKKEVGDLFKPGKHGSTFGGNPLACSAALATLKEIEKHKLWENAKKQGDALLKGLNTKLEKHPHVKGIRGKGLMIGIELDKPCRDILPLALKQGLLFNVTRDTVIRLVPPLILGDEHVKTIIDTLPLLIDQFYSN